MSPLRLHAARRPNGRAAVGISPRGGRGVKLLSYAEPTIRWQEDSRRAMPLECWLVGRDSVVAQASRLWGHQASCLMGNRNNGRDAHWPHRQDACATSAHARTLLPSTIVSAPRSVALPFTARACARAKRESCRARRGVRRHNVQRRGRLSDTAARRPNSAHTPGPAWADLCSRSS
jgi:hypothetical protein